MKTITLSQNKIALVDDDMYEYLNQFKWCAQKDKYTFYAIRTIIVNGHNRTYRMHRVIMNVTATKTQVDHRDHDGLNNQRSNLRTCTKQQNDYNRTSKKNSSSIYLGVSWHKRFAKWCASIRSNKRLIYLGYHDNQESAALAYDKKALELHGEFANLNFK